MESFAAPCRGEWFHVGLRTRAPQFADPFGAIRDHLMRVARVFHPGLDGRSIMTQLLFQQCP